MKYSKSTFVQYRIIKTLLLLLGLFIAVELFSQPKKTIKLVFIAGANDHCGTNPCHQYIEDLTYLKKTLEDSIKNSKFEIKLYIGERPPIGSLNDVAAVVVHSSGDRLPNEWHGLFLQNNKENTYENQAFLDDFQKQIDRGMGLMILHYSTWVDHPAGRNYMNKWLGGYFEKGVSKVDGDKKTQGTTAIETVDIVQNNHPILKGVSSWTLEDEYYYKLNLDTEAITPLLTSSLPLDSPEKQTIAWALNRKNKGRSVGFTGGHFHQNLSNPSYKKFIINSIFWISKTKTPN
ncbi:MAG: ThuA domain-containing protein [Leadbetterella sp.]